MWTCHEERPEVCRKKGDENIVPGKVEKREAEERISGCSKGRYGRILYEGQDIRDKNLPRRCGGTSCVVATCD